jgi:hypothetical protein
MERLHSLLKVTIRCTYPLDCVVKLEHGSCPLLPNIPFDHGPSNISADQDLDAIFVCIFGVAEGDARDIVVVSLEDDPHVMLAGEKATRELDPALSLMIHLKLM